jgi:hypothetical protein
MTNGMIPYNHQNTTPEFYRQHVSPIVNGQQPAPQRASSWLDVYRTMKEPEVASPTVSAVTGLRHNAEGGAVGAILGFIQGEFGTLDIRGKYPVDGIAALLLYAMSVRDAGKPDGFASDLRALSQSCTTILTYRKTREWREKSKVSSKDTPILARSTSVDPITEAGKRLLKKEEK